jgi:two-component system chemotaxis sensor kinase CheA
VEITMSNEDNVLLQTFVDESLKHLADIEKDLRFIEKGGVDLDEAPVDKVFRVVHSIKGSAGFVGLTVVKDLSQAIENILGLIRGRKLMPTPAVINALLLATEALQKLLVNAPESKAIDISVHLAALHAVATGMVSPEISPLSLDKPMQPTAEGSVSVPIAKSDPLSSKESAMSEAVQTQNVSSRQPENAIIASTATDQVGLDSSPVQTDTSLRVSVSLLDQLMNLAGELVLSRNQLLQTISSGAVHEAEAVGQRIDQVTSELQEAIMLTRMQPIGNVFGKFPRVVRDLSKMLGKQLDLTIIGQEVELDKTILEALGNPLTHLIRNGVIHGIETLEERVQKGKPRRGTMLLKAYHAAGQVVIEIHDDGRGVDGDLVAATALTRGLITAEQAKVMSAKERINLILLPGFPTAPEETDISGRGVGMDMVKANLDHLGGSIDIESTVGKGTTISIKLPLTLAIIPCQIIMTGDERYAIPQVNLEELLRIPAAQIKERVERVGDAEVVRLRGNLLPLIRMADVLTIERTYYDDEQSSIRSDRRCNIADRRSKTTPLFASATQTLNRSDAGDEETAGRHSQQDRRQSPASALNIVVVSTGVMKYGLIVDRLLDSEEIVIKPLGRHLQQCQGYAGATIMGDGRIALILDVANLARMAGLTSLEGSRRALELAEVARDSQTKSRDQESLLIFRSSSTEQFGVPLHLVERVEKIRQAEIEMLGNRRVLQYRGGSLPLVRLDDTAGVLPLVEQENLLVIVFHLRGRDVGLLASGPVDAVEVSTEIDVSTLRQPGIMGSAIISGKTTLLVDIFAIVQGVHPEWCPASASREEWAEGEYSATVLIVDDSVFFRNQVRSYLEEVGLKVLEGCDGVDAWRVLEENAETIAMVVTDIEMPNMDGFLLARKIKDSPQYNQLPVIALTTLAAEEDVAKGKAAGIDAYHIKLDRERLVECVCQYLQLAETV